MTKSQTGTIVAVFYLVYGCLQFLGGVLTDKWHPERFITFGFIGAGLCNLAVYFNQNYVFMNSSIHILSINIYIIFFF